ncbi:hypothetical protein JCM10207_004066 [Rhodosporidiobolus poonsookiae]
MPPSKKRKTAFEGIVIERRSTRASTKPNGHSTAPTLNSSPRRNPPRKATQHKEQHEEQQPEVEPSSSDEDGEGTDEGNSDDEVLKTLTQGKGKHEQVEDDDGDDEDDVDQLADDDEVPAPGQAQQEDQPEDGAAEQPSPAKGKGRSQRTYGKRGKAAAAKGGAKGKAKGRGKGKKKAPEPESEPEADTAEEEEDDDVDQLASDDEDGDYQDGEEEEDDDVEADDQPQASTSGGKASPSKKRAPVSVNDALSGKRPKLDKRYPPKLFMHPQKYKSDWEPDKIWLAPRGFGRDSYGSDKRAMFKSCIKEKGGMIMKNPAPGHIAVLPSIGDAYRESWELASEAGAILVSYDWLEQCLRASHGADKAKRLDPKKFAASAPARLTPRKQRAPQLTPAMMKRFAQLYLEHKDASGAGMTKSRHWMFEKMQDKFFDGYERTTTSAFARAFEAHKKEIIALARELLARRPPPPPPRRFPNSPSPSPSRSPSFAGDAAADVDPALVDLAAQWSRPLALVERLDLACTFDHDATDKLLEKVAEYNVWSAREAVEAQIRTDKLEALQEQMARLVWSAEADEDVRALDAEDDDAVEAAAKTWGKEPDEVRKRAALVEMDWETVQRERWWPDEEELERTLALEPDVEAQEED